MREGDVETFNKRTGLCFRFKDGVEVVERGSLAGMMALAVSDFFFCLITTAESFLRTHKLVYQTRCLSLYATMYGNYFQNLFVKLSTHITVVMAVYRYLAVAYPTVICKHLDILTKCKLICIVAGLVLWTLFLIPLLGMWNSLEISCVNNTDTTTTFIFLKPGTFLENTKNQDLFYCLWTVFGFLFPTVMLLFCNTGIVRAIRRSRSRVRTPSQSGQSGGQARSSAQRRTSVTLVCIVIAFFFLVAPSESVDFYLKMAHKETSQWMVAVTLFNVLLMVNMSFNFALYCAINSQFRRTIPMLYCVVNIRHRCSRCTICSKWKPPSGTRVCRQSTEVERIGMAVKASPTLV